MSRTLPVYKFLIRSLAILQLLSWNVETYRPNNYTLIKWINSRNLTWKAGENPTNLPPHPSASRKKPRLTALPRLKSEIVNTPDTFDARHHWSGCSHIISRIRSQGQCGSCWAVATATMLSDRTCVATNGSVRVHLSTEDMITCCSYCGAPDGSSCDGGWSHYGIKFWAAEGLVTGGEVNSQEGCKPYSTRSYLGKHVPCVKHCTNQMYPKEYEKDKHRGKLVYHVSPNEPAIRSEIYVYGPVVATMSVYKDFDQYKTGVYRYVSGDIADDHSVKIIGWGKESGVKYWLVANTWGAHWGGMRGYFKIVRGENHCNIELNVIAGRMYDTSSIRETSGKVANCANKRNLFFVKSVLVFGLLRLKMSIVHGFI